MTDKSMKEVTKELDVTIDTIRYYERIGLIKVARDKNGYRRFDQQAIDWLWLVKMLRKSGVSVESLVAYVQLVLAGDATIAARKDILLEQRDQLAAQIAEQKQVLDMLDQKLAGYEEHLLKFEQEKLYHKED